MPSANSRRGVFRSPHSTRGARLGVSSPRRRAWSVSTFTQPFAALGTWTQWISSGPEDACASTLSALSGRGTASGVRASSSARRAPIITNVRRPTAPPGSPLSSEEAATWVIPINSNARSHSGRVRRVISCKATMSGFRAAIAPACSGNRLLRPATFHVMRRTTPSHVSYPVDCLRPCQRAEPHHVVLRRVIAGAGSCTASWSACRDR